MPRILYNKINDLARLSGMQLKNFIQNFVSQTNTIVVLSGLDVVYMVKFGHSDWKIPNLTHVRPASYKWALRQTV